MTCSTCGDYQMVDSDGDGVYDAPCPDCNVGIVRCRVHGRRLHDGRCAQCRAEADVAEAAITRAREEREIAGAAA